MKITRSATALVAAVLLALVSAPALGAQPHMNAAALATQAQPSGEVTWGVVPATPDGTPDSRVSFRYNLAPGGTVSDQALVVNESAEPITFRVLASDGVTSASGAFDVLPSDEKPVDVGSWVTIQDSVEVPAGGAVLIPFTIAVPENATPGDHPGGIVVTLTQTVTEGEGPQVGLDTRVGVRIHLRVSGDIVPAVTIRDLKANYEFSINPFAPGRMHVSYTVTNDGNVRVGSIQQYTATGPFGLPTGAHGPSGTVVAQQREILPGQSARVSEVLESTWPLAYITTRVTASLERVGDDATFGAVHGASAAASTWAIPWPQLAALLVLAALVLAVMWLAKRRRAHRAAELAAAREQGAREAAASSGPQPTTS